MGVKHVGSMAVVLLLFVTACGVPNFGDSASSGGPQPEVPGLGDGGTGPGVGEAQAALRALANDRDQSEEGDGGEGADVAPVLSAVQITGVVVTKDDMPLPGAVVVANDPVGEPVQVATGDDGSFTLTGVAEGAALTVRRPVWQLATAEYFADGPPPIGGAAGEEVTELVASAGAHFSVVFEPVVARVLRMSREVAADPAQREELYGEIERSTVNALVFDTKDETDTVLYNTEVSYAHEIGAVEVVYDPVELLAEARDRGLYTITRIVTFEDSTWADQPEAKLAGEWVNAANEANWQYPIDLAIEACEIGFDEIQFDYVRFPAGKTAAAAQGLIPDTSNERAATIKRFLAAARDELHPRGCGISAAIFGITMNSPTDEGIGQTPETVSEVVDAVSPMLYPSHYGPGWLGFDDPNAHPGPVIASALDVGGPRLAPQTLLRPWIQGFYYNAEQVKAQINEAEARGAGWLIWNASGRYAESWLPPRTDAE